MSFDFWANKFLARGYKVGKVEQAETSIGAEMRVAAGGSSGNAKGAVLSFPRLFPLLRPCSSFGYFLQAVDDIGLGLSTPQRKEKSWSSVC
jgi:hypothetical protein